MSGSMGKKKRIDGSDADGNRRESDVCNWCKPDYCSAWTL